MAEHYLAVAQQGTLAGIERCQVMLHVDVDTLKGSGSHAKHCRSHCHADGHWIAPTTAKRLCCDASLVTVLEDDKGNVLNIGRRSRIIPPAIARALAIRDTSCRFPSCCASQYLDAHHIQHWADGGETKLNNLVTLCRHHHRLLHQGEFTVSVKSDCTNNSTNDSANDASMVFTTRDGERIETNYFPQFPKSVPAGTLSDYFLEYFPAVNERTALRGKRMGFRSCAISCFDQIGCITSSRGKNSAMTGLISNMAAPSTAQIRHIVLPILLGRPLPR